MSQTFSLPTLGYDAPDAVRLGRFLDRQEGRIAGRMSYNGDRGILVFGPNGSGKSMRLLVPNLLQCTQRSILVVDPKGELAAITADFRRRLGQVVILNPFGVLTGIPGYELQSSGFNPLARLDPTSASFNEDAAQLADALVTVGGNDPHWDESARALIAAIIMYVVMEARHIYSKELAIYGDADSLFRSPRSVPTMARVRELLCMASDEPSAENDFMGVGIPALALAMMRSNIAGLRNKAAQFTTWSREVQSIASAAKRQTEAFDDTFIAADMAKDGFDFAEMKRRPVTVYLILPPTHIARHAKWLRLVITSALQALLRPRLPDEPKALFMLDEFAALGHMQIIETVWAMVRGYGIQFMPIFQDLTQLKAIYKERWETFIAQAGAVIAFGPNDMTTAQWIASRAGETKAIIANNNESRSTSTGWTVGATNTGASGSLSEGRSGGESISTSTSFTQTKVPLIQPHSLFGMGEGATLTFLAGLSDVIPGYVPAHWEIGECKRRGRDNPYYLQ